MVLFGGVLWVGHAQTSPDTELTVRPYAWRMNRERVQNRYCFIPIRVAITRAVPIMSLSNQAQHESARKLLG